ERQTDHEWRLGRLQNQMGQVLKSTSHVLEGFPSVEHAWATHGEQQQYRELRQDTPEALGRDVAAHLNAAWPLPDRSADPPGPLTTAVWLRLLLEELGQENVARAVFEQRRCDATAGARVSIPGVFKVFKIKLQFGAASLGAQQAIQALDRPLRQASGLAVLGVAPAAAAAGAALASGVIQGKGRGKGKGKNGKGAKAKVAAAKAGAGPAPKAAAVPPAAAPAAAGGAAGARRLRRPLGHQGAPEPEAEV
ncbi:unnamed protein product, partial [Prorocentrum cordatum]